MKEKDSPPTPFNTQQGERGFFREGRNKAEHEMAENQGSGEPKHSLSC